MGFFGRERIVGKTPEQLALMRTAGLLVGRTLALLAAEVKPGMTTLDLDTLAETHIRDHGGIPNFQLVPGYRHTLCTSVNDEIVHGIPTATRVLQEGDLLSIDCGAEVKGWNGDAAFSCIVGGRDAGRPEDLALIDDTEASLWAGIAALAVGKSLYAVGAAIEDSLTAAGESRGIEYGIVEDYVGHGIGTEMHMAPDVPNFAIKHRGPKLVPGTALAIEPMLVRGGIETSVLADDWTVVTVDGSRASQWEHSVCLHSRGVWVLTAEDGGASGLEPLGIHPVPIPGS